MQEQKKSVFLFSDNIFYRDCNKKKYGKCSLWVFFIFSGIVSQLMLLGIIWKSEDRNRKIRGNEILTIVFMVEITAEAFRQKDILYGVWYASVAMVFVWTLGKVRGNHGEKWSYVKI